MAPIGRDRELAALSSALGDGRVVLIEGEAGIGKTTLRQAAVEQAESRVLTCSPAGAETQLSLSALRDLLEDAFAEAEGALPEPQRRAGILGGNVRPFVVCGSYVIQFFNP